MGIIRDGVGTWVQCLLLFLSFLALLHIQARVGWILVDQTFMEA